MNEIEYMLRQDAREKKAAGRGIYHKRSGSKSTYVGLPSDHLTAAEKKRRNGPVSTYNINKRLSFEEFKELPVDLASEYISRLQDTYNVGAERIADSMGVTGVSLTKYLDFRGIERKRFRGQHRLDPRWPFFYSDRCSSTGEYFPSAQEEPKPAPVIPEPSAPEIKAKLGDIDLGGSATPEAILAALTAAFSVLTSPDQTYEFAIHLHAEGGED